MTQLAHDPNSSRPADFDRPLLLTPGQDLAGYAASHAGKGLLLLITCVSVLAVLLIFYFIAATALPFFQTHGVKEFLGSTTWLPTADAPQFGILTMLAGSLYITLGATLIAVPVALCIAVFLSDIAPFRVRQWVKPLLEMLAAIPSVAYGFFAVLVVAPWMQEHLGFTTGSNALNASLILAVMAVPTIASVSEDALSAVGRELREGSYALGATRAETVVKVLIPAAHSGIFAAVILGMMRAIGETMVVWMASGNARQIPEPWWNLSKSVGTITAAIAQEINESSGDLRLALFAMALVLLAITFVMNTAGEYFLTRSRQLGHVRRPPARERKHAVHLHLIGHFTRLHDAMAERFIRIVLPLRRVLDKAFTTLAGGMVLLMLATLVIILGPMLYRGSSAVVFRDTVEFRNFQYQVFGRGDQAAIAAQNAEFGQYRRQAYEILGRFGRGIETDALTAQVRATHRAYRDMLDERTMGTAERRAAVEASKAICDDLQKAIESTDHAAATALLESAIKKASDPAFKSTPAEKYLSIAVDYRPVAGMIDPAHRDKYKKGLQQVSALVRELLGPPEGDKSENFWFRQYGATRWDRALELQHDILWADNWVQEHPDKPRINHPYRREADFAGTEMTKLFSMVENGLEPALQPGMTCYWQYFTDNSQPGHLMGGIGPEIWGTLLLAVLTMVFAVPLGVISAGYLVECGGDNIVIRVIRAFVNTLAGVPSIVFGLFGLVFFELVLLPRLGIPGGGKVHGTIWAGALTLTLLVLPLMIRASEEAIRAVPVAFKEAALALGAGKFRAFVTVTLPAALPGILTGVILSLSRAAGETAPVIFCAAAVWTSGFATSLSDETRTLSYGSYTIAVNEPNAAKAPHNQYGMVMTLVVLVLLLNLAAILIRSRLAKRLRGA